MNQPQFQTSIIVFLFLLVVNSFVWADVNQESRVDEIVRYNALHKTLSQYLISSETGDIETLKSLHHESAILRGFIHGESVVGGPSLLIEQIQKVGSPKANGEPVSSTVSYTQVDGDIASAEVQFVNFWCGTGTHHMQLIRVDGQWKIFSDLFWFRAMPEGDKVSESCIKKSNSR